MIGVLERGEIRTRCEVVSNGERFPGYKGRLSVPGYGTRFTDSYPDRNDAVAALVDLRGEVYGRAMPAEALPEITIIA